MLNPHALIVLKPLIFFKWVRHYGDLKLDGTDPLGHHFNGSDHLQFQPDLSTVKVQYQYSLLPRNHNFVKMPSKYVKYWLLCPVNQKLINYNKVVKMSYLFSLKTLSHYSEIVTYLTLWEYWISNLWFFLYNLNNPFDGM